MNFLSFVWDILDFTTWIGHWRLSLCLLLGGATAVAAYGQIAVDPWRWLAGGAILLVSAMIGLRWEASSD